MSHPTKKTQSKENINPLNLNNNNNQNNKKIIIKKNKSKLNLLNSIENTCLNCIYENKNNINNKIISNTKNFKEDNKPFWSNINEKYSILKIKKIKNKKFSPYKSTNQLYNKIENEYDNDFNFLKQKKISSLKKVYISNINFIDSYGKNKNFKLFRDCDIGLNDEKTGMKIKIQIIENDDDSSDETIEKSVDICKHKLKEAIQMIQNKSEYAKKYWECIKLE